MTTTATGQNVKRTRAISLMAEAKPERFRAGIALAQQLMNGPQNGESPAGILIGNVETHAGGGGRWEAAVRIRAINEENETLIGVDVIAPFLAPMALHQATMAALYEKNNPEEVACLIDSAARWMPIPPRGENGAEEPISQLDPKVAGNHPEAKARATTYHQRRIDAIITSDYDYQGGLYLARHDQRARASAAQPLLRTGLRTHESIIGSLAKVAQPAGEVKCHEMLETLAQSTEAETGTSAAPLRLDGEGPKVGIKADRERTRLVIAVDDKKLNAGADCLAALTGAVAMGKILKHRLDEYLTNNENGTLCKETVCALAHWWEVDLGQSGPATTSTATARLCARADPTDPGTMEWLRRQAEAATLGTRIRRYGRYLLNRRSNIQMLSEALQATAKRMAGRE